MCSILEVINSETFKVSCTKSGFFLRLSKKFLTTIIDIGPKTPVINATTISDDNSTTI